MYLVAFLDWYSRYVVAWELSDTLELPFVLWCAETALSMAVPQIVNSDQGSHFTSERFTGRFLEAGSRVRMDGRGRCMDNIFTERLWRSVKQEEVYLSEYASPREARQGIAQYLWFYNQRRPHQALGYKTPAQVVTAASLEAWRQQREASRRAQQEARDRPARLLRETIRALSSRVEPRLIESPDGRVPWADLSASEKGLFGLALLTKIFEHGARILRPQPPAYITQFSELHLTGGPYTENGRQKLTLYSGTRNPHTGGVQTVGRVSNVDFERR